MLLLLAGALVAARPSAGEARPERGSPEAARPSAAEEGPIRTDELSARMPADLGPATVDVSTYPPAQQKNYALFLNRCSRCHTPARALNSKIATPEDWQHYVSLMHGRLLSRSMGESWKTEEGQAIIDFLVYDSQVRKTAHPREFESLQVRLAERFKLMQREKERRAKEQPAKPSAPYTGDNR
jgi:hypothetical protein